MHCIECCCVAVVLIPEEHFTRDDNVCCWSLLSAAQEFLVLVSRQVTYKAERINAAGEDGAVLEPRAVAAGTGIAKGEWVLLSFID